MPVNGIQQEQAESLYIDSMFDVVSETEEAVVTYKEEIVNDAESTVEAESSIKIEDVEPVETTDDLYQLILVSGMTFAVPLLEIRHAAERADVEIENGLLDYDDESYSVVDISYLMKPEKLETDSEYYLLIADRQIAIACNEITTAREIDDASVCWRSEDSKRQWLAGTIKNEGIALLDIAILQQMQFSD